MERTHSLASMEACPHRGQFKEGCGAGRSGVEEALDEEMDKCNLLWKNCHHVKTNYRDMMDTRATTAQG